MDDCVGVHLGRLGQSRDGRVAIRLVPGPPKMLVDRGRRNQDDAWGMGLYARMGNDGRDVGLELVEGNVLLVGCIW